MRYLSSNLTDKVLELFFYLSLFFLCCGLVYYGITNYSFLGHRTIPGPGPPPLVPNYPARIILIISGIGAAAVFLKTIDTVASLREDD